LLKTDDISTLPDERGVSGEEDQEELEILQYLDRLEEVTEAFFSR